MSIIVDVRRLKVNHCATAVPIVESTYTKTPLEHYSRILDRDGFNFVINKYNSNNESTSII